MQIAALRHTDIAEELALLRLAVSSAMEVMLTQRSLPGGSYGRDGC
jgi:hypothetical protein